MLGSLAKRLAPTPSMVVAGLALVVALGGTSYAALRIPARSVGPTQLKSNAVTRAKIANNAIDRTKVAFNTLTGDDINEKTLKKVGTALQATSSAGLDKIYYKTATGSVGPNGQAAATANCDAGQKAITGGVKVEDIVNTFAVDGYPAPDGAGWTVHVGSIDGARGHGFAVIAVCVPAGGIG